MKNFINRRSFIKSSAAAGAGMLIGSGFLPKITSGFIPDELPDISIINGTDYYKSALKAVETLGGMQKFVRPGQSVGLLINSAFTVKGAYVNPDISLAIIKLCKDAGAGKIALLQVVDDEYWTWGDKYEELKNYLGNITQVKSNKFPAEFNDADFELIKEIPGAKILKDIEVIREAGSCDVLIDIAIAKHHATTLYTGAIKNMMGICTRKTNVNMHLGSGTRNDPDYLGQSIAEICLYRKPDLVVMDATEFITSNGPVGPGEVVKPDKVVSGTDIVAVDALCSSYLNHNPDEIVTTLKAYESGLGEINYKSLSISEITL